MMEREFIEQIVTQVLIALSDTKTADAAAGGIPVGISNRHIHLSAEHSEMLFGSGYELTRQKELKQTDEFAAAETVTLVGAKDVIRGVRVLGPVRKTTQIELSRTDGFSLGIVPPLRDSGDIAGSAGIIVAGPRGAVALREGVICAARHIHMRQEDARRFRITDGERVTVEVSGQRGGSLDNVLIRVHPDFRPEFHIDTDEANALGLKNGDLVALRGKAEV